MHDVLNRPMTLIGAAPFAVIDIISEVLADFHYGLITDTVK